MKTLLLFFFCDNNTHSIDYKMTYNEYTTPYKISTITTTGSVNTEIELKILFDSIDIEHDIHKEGVSYVEFGIHKKGISKKNKTNKRKPLPDEKEKKKFDNQVTLEYRIYQKNMTDLTLINVKIFNNGNLQMTGVKYVEQGSIFIDKFIAMLKSSSYNICKKECLENKNYTIQLINCDYKVGFCVKRDILFRIMINDYDNMCSYEPCIYPGVKIQYMWHTTNKTKDGICYCKDTCIHGKGNGISENSCKKITIAVFQSGSVIITGAHNIEQINQAYEWINNLLLCLRSRIEKKNIVLPTINNETHKDKILLQKSKIVNLKKT